MFPLGDLNVAMFTVAVDAVVVDVVVVGVEVVCGVLDVVEVDGVVVEKLKLLDVLVTVTVLEPPDPHPARTTAATRAAPTSRFTVGSVPVHRDGVSADMSHPPRREAARAADLGADGVPSRLLTDRPRGVGSTHEHDQRTSRATHP